MSTKCPQCREGYLQPSVEHPGTVVCNICEYRPPVVSAAESTAPVVQDEHDVDCLPISLDDAAIRDLAEQLTDASEGIFHLAGEVGDGDVDARMNGIRALSRHLDELVARLSRVARGAES